MNELKMAVHQKTLDVAVALTPLMAYLRKMGVLVVEGAEIQLTAEKFREIWPDVTPDSKGFLFADYCGIIFTAWGGDPND